MSSPQSRQSRRRKRDELEFLPAALEVLETPPRPAARLTALTISAFFAAAIAWSLWGEIDTVAIAQGQLVTTERAKLIQPIENGVIRAIHVADGQQVRQGDVLVELDPTETKANIEALKSDLIKAKLDAASAEAILSDDPETNLKPTDDAERLLAEATRLQMLGEYSKHKAELDALDSEMDDQEAAFASLKSQLEKQTRTLPYAQDRVNVQEGLKKKELARSPDVQQAHKALIDTEGEILSIQANMEQAEARRSGREKKRQETIAAFRATHLEKRGEALRKIAAFEQQIRKEERRAADRTLRAPITGTVFGLSVYTVGGVVTTKDVLLRIVPANSALEAEVVVLNKDIGFVEKGQAAEIKLETFPFTRYGLIDGAVKEVWQDAVPDEKQGLVYKAQVSLKTEKILVGSKWVPLAPGMSVQVEIKTGTRRVIDYFLSPLLRYRDESLRER